MNPSSRASGRPGGASEESVASNIISNWILLASGVVYALVITPIIVKALDKELYGVWSFLNGLLAYSEVLYLGLGSAIIKHVARHRAEGDSAAVSRIGSVVVLIYGILGAVCFAVLVLISGWIPNVFANTLPHAAAWAASYTCVLLGAQIWFVFIGSAFSGLVCGYNRYDLVNGVALVSVVIRFVATPLLVRAGHNPLLMLAFLTSGVTLFQAVASIGIAFRYVPNLAIRLTRPTGEELRMLYGFGVQSFFISFAVRLITYTDTTVIGVKLGAESVALYSFPLQLVEYGRTFLAGFSGVFLPRLTALTTRGDMAAVRQAYIKTIRIAAFLGGWLAALLVYLGPMFLNRWVGPEFGTPVQMVLFWLALATFAQVLSTQAPYGFYQALHLVSFPAIVLTIEAILNLGLSIWLAPRMGIAGVALATALPAVIVSPVLLLPYLCRRLGVPLRTLLIEVALPGLLMAVASLAAMRLVGVMITSHSYAGIVSRLAVTVPVALALFRGTFPTEQRAAIWRRLRFNSA